MLYVVLKNIDENIPHITAKNYILKYCRFVGHMFAVLHQEILSHHP